MHEIRRLTVLGRYGYDSIPTITQFVAEAATAASLDENEVFHCQIPRPLSSNLTPPLAEGRAAWLILHTLGRNQIKLDALTRNGEREEKEGNNVLAQQRNPAVARMGLCPGTF